MAKIPLLLPLLVCPLVAAPAAAQTGGLDIPAPEPEEPSPQQGEDPGSEQEPQAGAANAEDAPAAPMLWADPQNPAEEIFLAFETAGDTRNAAREQALEELRKLGLGTRTTALKALESGFGPSVLLGAELLEWVGTREDVDALVVAASRAPLVEAVGTCLETARRLNGGWLPERAVQLLGHPRRQVRTVTEARLQAQPHVSHVPGLLRYLKFGRDLDMRVRAARQLAEHEDDEDARRALRGLLAGEHQQLAFLAVDALAGDGDDADVAWLREEFLTADAQQEAAYLAHGLIVLQQEDDARVLITPELEPRLRVMLDDEDVFVAGVGAAGLAELVFRTDFAEGMDELHAKLPYALVRAVGGARFYPQYARFSPVAERALEHVTGEDFGEQAGDAWVRWYEEHGADFRAVRGRLDIVDADLPRLRVSWARGADGPRTLIGPEAAWAHDDRVIGGEALAEMSAALRETGLLQTEMLPGTYGVADADLDARIEIAIGERRKRLSFRGGAGAEWLPELLQSLDERWRDQRWQLLAPRTAAGHEFVVAHLDDFAGAQGEQRAAAMVDLTRGRVSALEDETLRTWCAELREVPGVARRWDAALALEFLRAAAERTHDPDLGMQLVAVALPRPDLDVRAEMIELFADAGEPARSSLLQHGLERLGMDACVAALQDERIAVRTAGVRAMSGFGADAVPELVAVLDDASPLMQRLALRGLGEVGASAAQAHVLPYAAEGMPPELRKEALWALGRVGDAGAVPELVDAARGGRTAVVITALDALAEIPGPEADRAVGALFPEFAGTALESSYLRTLMARGGAAARRALHPYLLHDDSDLARHAALLAGRLGDPAAAPHLMDWLPRAPRDRELLEALAMTLCVDFRNTPDPAGTYQAWWRDHGDLGSAAWLRMAANDAGFDLPAGFQDASRNDPRASVDVLLDVVEQGPPHLRGAAAYFLHGMTGVDTQVVLYGTPQGELERRVQPWREWLN